MSKHHHGDNRERVSAADSIEYLELLRASTPPSWDDEPGHDELSEIHFDEETRAEIRHSLAGAHIMRARHRPVGMFIVVLGILTVSGLIAFGAVGLFGQTTTSAIERGDPGQITVAGPALVERGAPVEPRSDQLAGQRIDSFEPAAAPVGASPRKKARSRSEPASSSSVERDDPVGASVLIDDNPYGGVSLASVLDEAVTDAAFGSSVAPEPARGSSAIDELIESAVAGPGADPTKAGAASSTRSLPSAALSSLPLRPTKGAVRSALGAIGPRVRDCADEPYGRLVVRLTVAGDTGRVTSARAVDSEHAGTSIGACAAKAVRLARFPKFQQDQVVIKYPFDL
jgi:hypothetical protein